MTCPENVLTLRLRITGRVQGVGYRDWTVREARAAGLQGWVRNRVDGSVEALVSGMADSVEAFVERARTGPRLARVASIDCSPAERPGEPGFSWLPTL